METEYIPHDDPVFHLTPPVFHDMAKEFWDDMGHPNITVHNFWDVYLDLLERFKVAQQVPDLSDALQSQAKLDQILESGEWEIPLLSDQRDLREGDSVIGPGGTLSYMGGLAESPAVAVPASIRDEGGNVTGLGNEDEDEGYNGFGEPDRDYRVFVNLTPPPA